MQRLRGKKIQKHIQKQIQILTQLQVQIQVHIQIQSQIQMEKQISIKKRNRNTKKVQKYKVNTTPPKKEYKCQYRNK